MSSTKSDLMRLKVPKGLDTIDDIVDGYKAYQILAMAVDKGLFDWLEEHGKSTREEISNAMGINGMFIRSYLQALVDMGMLKCRNDRFANTKLATGFLVSSQPFYQGDWLKVMSGKGSRWDDLGATMLLDKPGADNFYAGPSHSFISAIAERSLRGELQAVSKAIETWKGFQKARRVLDLGGGHGLYAIALCQANPGLEAVVFDKPHVIDITRDFIRDYSMEDRITTMGGDMTKADFGQGFDIVIISHILYKYRRNLPAIFSRANRCLNPGGLLASNHWFCGPGCGAAPGGLQELDKSLNSFGHPLCHPDEFGEALETNGFSLVDVTEVPSAYANSTLHLAVKGKPKHRRATKKDKSCDC